MFLVYKKEESCVILDYKIRGHPTNLIVCMQWAVEGVHRQWGGGTTGLVELGALPTPVPTHPSIRLLHGCLHCFLQDPEGHSQQRRIQLCRKTIGDMRTWLVWWMCHVLCVSTNVCLAGPLWEGMIVSWLLWVFLGLPSHVLPSPCSSNSKFVREKRGASLVFFSFLFTKMPFHASTRWHKL